MRLASDQGDFLELADDSTTDAHDVPLTVRARFRGFSTEVSVWVAREAWIGFTQDLVVLEERRQGRASLEGMSPGELSLVIRSLDRAGHMGIEATVGARGYDYTASLQFGVLGFAPSQLPAFVRVARHVAERLR